MTMHENVLSCMAMHQNHEKECEMGAKRVNIIVMHGYKMYQCAMCGDWHQYTEHIENNMEWFKSIWNEVDIGQMMGSDTYTTITRGKVTKPFVCVNCLVMESGSI